MKTVKVFISSTFKDMNAERDVLIKNVFPRLCAKAEAELNVRIQEIDLRWGVTDEQAARGQVLDLCLNGIDECRPYFLCMIGKRYGWIPTPMHINMDVFEKICANLSGEEKSILTSVYKSSVNNRVISLDIKAPEVQKEKARRILLYNGVAEAGMAITEREIDHALNENSIPYVIKNLDKAINNNRDKLPDDEIKLIEDNYKKRSQDEWILEPGISDEEKVKVAGLIERIGLKKGYHAFFFIRKDCGEDSKDFIETDGEQKRRLHDFREMFENPNAELKKKVVKIEQYNCSWRSDPDEGQHHIYDLKNFENTVYESLWEHLKNNPELKIPEVKLEGLELEEELQLRFAENHIWNFCGRNETLEELQDKVRKALCGELTNDSGIKTRYLMLIGEPGSGKSAVMAKLKDCLSKRDTFKEALIIGRFVGATGNSTVARNLMNDFVGILKKEFCFADEVPFELDDIKKLFVELLKRVNRQVIILIDAVNQLRKERNPIAWLPLDLPDNAVIVLSLVTDDREKSGGYDIEEDNRFVKEIRKWHEKPCEMPLKALSDDERKDIIYTYLKQINKNITEPQVDFIIKKKEASHPLFLQVVLEELRMVSRHEDLPLFFSETLQDSIEGMFDKVLNRLEDELEFVFENAGRDMFIDFVRFMAIGRNGMTEDDLRLLCKWQEINKDAERKIKRDQIKDKNITDFHWTELRRSLRAYLFQSGAEWNFFHQQLKQAVYVRYLGSDEKRHNAHNEVADYLKFMGLEYITSAKDLPYHLKEADRIDELREVLTTFKWMNEKLIKTNLGELVSDYSLLAESDIELIRAALRLSSHTLKADARQLPSQLYGRLLGAIGNVGINKLLKQIEQWNEYFWLKPTNICFNQVGGSLIRSLSGHTDVVDAAFISQDGKTIISESGDDTLKVWDIASGEEIRTIPGSSRFINKANVFKDKKRVVLKSANILWNTLVVWNIDTGESTLLSGHFKPVVDVCITPDGKKVISSARDNSIRIWDVETSTVMKIIALPGKELEVSLSMTSDGKRLIAQTQHNEVYGTDYALRIWDIKPDIPKLIIYKKGVRKFRITPDELKVIIIEKDTIMKVYDLRTGRVLRTLSRHADHTSDICITPDSKHAISASENDGLMKVWDINSGKAIRGIKEENSITIGDIIITADGKKIITDSGYGSVIVWDFDTGRLLKKMEGYCKLICITPDGKRIIFGSKHLSLIVMDIETGEEIRALETKADSIKSCIVTSDGNRAISTSVEKVICLWDISEKEYTDRIARISGYILDVTILPNGKEVVFSFPGNLLVFWSLEKGVELRSAIMTVDNHLTTVMPGRKSQYSGKSGSLRITPDGKRAIWGSNGEASMWDIASGMKINMLPHTNEANSVWITQDGRRVFYWSNSGIEVRDLETSEEVIKFKGEIIKAISVDGKKAITTMRLEQSILDVWDIETGDKIVRYSGHRDPDGRTGNSLGVCIAPDGKKVISTSQCYLAVWDIETGIEIITLSGHRDTVNGVCTTSDNQLVISVSNDKTLKVWDINTGCAISTFYCENACMGCAISTDGKKIVAWDKDGFVYFLDTGNLLSGNHPFLA